MKVVLAVAAVMVALLASALTGGLLTATGEEPRSRSTQVRAADDDSPRDNSAAREFVAAKKTWASCVAKAAPAHDAADGRFDPEQACGSKPHPHDIAGKKHQGHGPPAWAGGPDRRTAGPPGHAKRH